ncbi:MAG: response regulator transcription factor [Bacteroidetes bacterium]|nr:response regulator transcription factor [Bacteroidota bacterium]
MNSAHIIVIEDDSQLRQLYVQFLQENGYPSIEPYPSVAHFLDQLNLNQVPDLILLDIMLGTQNALLQLPKIKLLLPQVPVIIVTGYQDEQFLFQALKEGADSYFIKGDSLDKLQEAIRQTLLGNAYLSTESTNQLVEYYRNAPPLNDPLHLFLTDVSLKYRLKKREMEVLNGLLAGKRYKEIASDMHVSINTVRHYVVSLYQKMNINKKEELLLKLKP